MLRVLLIHCRIDDECVSMHAKKEQRTLQKSSEEEALKKKKEEETMLLGGLHSFYGFTGNK